MSNLLNKKKEDRKELISNIFEIIAVPLVLCGTFAVFDALNNEYEVKENKKSKTSQEYNNNNVYQIDTTADYIEMQKQSYTR